MLAIEGKLVKGVKIEDADKAVCEQLQKIQADLIEDSELQKVKNKTESIIAFEDMSIMSRASSLANYELLGDADLMNTELDRYQAITSEDIREYSKLIFDEANSNTLYYRSKN